VGEIGITLEPHARAEKNIWLIIDIIHSSVPRLPFLDNISSTPGNLAHMNHTSFEYQTLLD